MLLFALLFLSAFAARAQWRQPPTTGSLQEMLADRTNYAGMSGLSPQLEASLVNRGDNAKNKQAQVEVEVWGVDLIEPDSNREPKLTEAYLTYRLDNQPIIKTADKEQTFRNLTPGRHQIAVQLALSDGQPLGSAKVLDLRIPR
jgi:hypothetical protein